MNINDLPFKKESDSDLLITLLHGVCMFAQGGLCVPGSLASGCARTGAGVRCTKLRAHGRIG